MAFIKLIRETRDEAGEKQAKALNKTANSTVSVNRETERDLRIQRRKRSDSHRRQQTRRTSARTKDVNNRLTQLRKATLQGSTRRRKDENRTWKTEGTITLNEIIGAVLSTAGSAVGGALKGAGKAVGGAVKGGAAIVKPTVRQGSSTTGAVLKAPLNVVTGKTSDARAVAKAKAAKLKKQQAETPVVGGAQ